MTAANRPRVAVVGSLAIDHFALVEALPLPGETVSARRFERCHGGNGANQAVAAARQGAETFLIGALGRDDDGRRYRKRLQEEGIDPGHLSSSREPTASTLVTIDPSGSATAVVSRGANNTLDPEAVRAKADLLRSCDLVLVQFEIPYDAVLEAGRIANVSSIPLVINASPPDPEFPWQELRTHCLVVNEAEAALLLGCPPQSESPAYVRQAIHEMRVEHLVVTRGDASTLVYSRTGDCFEVETLPAIPVDPYGAGDAFAGCLAARLAANESIEQAVRAANCAGALATLGVGTQESIPDRAAVEQHLGHLSSTGRR